MSCVLYTNLMGICRGAIYNLFDIVMESVVTCGACGNSNIFPESYITLPLDVKVS